LSPGVVVEAGALVENSILWDNVLVAAGARLSQVVADKRVRFMPGAQLGLGETVPNKVWPQSLSCGATLVGMDAQISGEARVGKNCIIAAETEANVLQTSLSSGQNVNIDEVLS